MRKEAKRWSNAGRNAGNAALAVTVTWRAGTWANDPNARCYQKAPIADLPVHRKTEEPTGDHGHGHWHGHAVLSRYVRPH
uniref:Putative secreted protein n=1 Tax=Anopheles darlingi TaxID=43151 RepID=A0A2M4D5U6_ANODA